jgi:hypothetical protein
LAHGVDPFAERKSQWSYRGAGLRFRTFLAASFALDFVLVDDHPFRSSLPSSSATASPLDLNTIPVFPPGNVTLTGVAQKARMTRCARPLPISPFDTKLSNDVTICVKLEARLTF